MSVEFNYIHTPYDGYLTIVTWADGTPAQLAAMIQAHDDGLIDLRNYWSIGDVRNIRLSAIAANPNGAFTTAQDAQTIKMALTSEVFSGNIHYQVDQINCLNTEARYNATDINTQTKNSSLLFIDLQNLYAGAFPADELALYKTFSARYDNVNGSPNPVAVSGKFHLRAEKEIFGSRTYSSTAEADALSQINYYTVAANRIKYVGSGTSKGAWWTRSRDASGSTNFAYVKSAGTEPATYKATNNRRVAPFGAI